VNHELNERVKCNDDCDIESMVRNVTSQLSGFMLQKRAKIFLNLAIKQVKCARTYMESLLYNLISNSIKYSRPGVPLEINISTHMEHGHAVLEVKDNGMGIDMEKYGDKIFMLNQTFHKGHDSTGVGLYITREHIESLGGKISVKSKVNAGTEFIVVL
jgi:signal transduction histidine kinase